jgi:hypothetical protein
MGAENNPNEPGRQPQQQPNDPTRQNPGQQQQQQQPGQQQPGQQQPGQQRQGGGQSGSQSGISNDDMEGPRPADRDPQNRP